MSDILEQITAAKRLAVEHMKAVRPLNQLRATSGEVEHISFAGALRSSKPVKIIAEIKKASPSKGVLIETFQPAELASRYCLGGAAALSVLTEEQFFQGSLEHIRLAKSAAALPVLCKDFIVDPYQIHLAAHAGADAILLIVKLLTRRTLADFLAVAAERSLDALVEVHSEDELEIALHAGAGIIGVNNRDLSTFATSLTTAERLAGLIPHDRIKVAESGIFDRDDIRCLAKAGYDCFLIGEALVKSSDPVELLKAMQR